MNGYNNVPKQQILNFQIDNICACLDIQFITKVFLLSAVQRIPESPPYIVGMMNMSGKSITIVDLAMRMGLDRKTQYSVNTPVLLCQYKDKVKGFIVDKVLGLKEIDPKSLQKMGERNESHSQFSGTVVIDDKQSLLIDPVKLFKESGSID